MYLHYSAISDVGRVRRENQDSGYAGPWLLTVCDGVGGAVRAVDAAHVEHRLGGPGVVAAELGRPGGAHVLDGAAEHVGDQADPVEVGHRAGVHGAPVAQHGDPVADGEHLLEDRTRNGERMRG